jgi:hypothetical protein
MTEAEQLAAAFAGLGASEAQARTMAAQLLKRADQLAAERGIGPAEALRDLLEVVRKGRAGEVPARFQPPSA